MHEVITEQLELDLFDSDRWPRKPYCSDDLSSGVYIRSLQSAIKKPYIQANPPYLRVWSIYDIDRPGGAIAWEDANLPPPSWAAANRENAHAHLVWGLSAPVLVDSPDMRQGPLRYLCAVEAAFREKLKADQGYAGLITKNPAHPLWRTLRGPQLAYDLGDLAEWVDLTKYIPKRKPEEIGLGRNVTVFDWLRHWAYAAVRKHREQRNFVLWQAEAYDKALERNGDLLYPLDGREVWHIAKSVSKWVWRKDKDAQARFIERQSEKGCKGGKASGISRLAASEDKRASARIMAVNGLTHGAIADELGVSRRTILRWLESGV